MSDVEVTARVVDRGNDSRIVGQIIPPQGTTVGNVLTATAGGSSWQTGGGGGGVSNLDGGTAGSVYLNTQNIDGGTA